MGLYTPTILGGNSYFSWFYDRGQYKTQHTGTSKGLSQAINRGPIRKFLPKYANVYVTIQSHSAYVTVNGVRNGLRGPVLLLLAGLPRPIEAVCVCGGGGGGILTTDTPYMGHRHINMAMTVIYWRL